MEEMTGGVALKDVYLGWERYNLLLKEMITPLTPDQLALRVTPALRSVGEMAAHIIAARAWWWRGVMGEGGADLESLFPWDDEGAKPRSAAELEIGLDKTWSAIAASLSLWTPADLGASFTQRRGSETTDATRQWIIWHVSEHDIHHGGEISLTLGAHGLSAPDL